MLTFLSKTKLLPAVSVRPNSSGWPEPLPDTKALTVWLRTKPSADFKVPAAAIALTRQGKFATAVQEVEYMMSVGYCPRADCRPVRIQCPVDWVMDPLKDRNWRSQLNMLRLLDPLLRAFEQTKDATFLRRAFDYCLDWARYHGSRADKNPFAWVDMVVGIRAQRLSYLCERLRYGAFEADADERALFARMLAEHWRRLTSPGFFKYTDHTILDIHGLTALLRAAFPDSASQADWERAIGQHLDHVLDIQFDEHGVHRENSPGYQFVAKNMFVALQRSRWYARISPKLGRTLERAAAGRTMDAHAGRAPRALGGHRRRAAAATAHGIGPTRCRTCGPDRVVESQLLLLCSPYLSQ